MTCDDPDALHGLQAQIPRRCSQSSASQVVGIVRDLAREAPLRSLAVTGGHNLRSQSKNLSQVTLEHQPTRMLHRVMTQWNSVTYVDARN